MGSCLSCESKRSPMATSPMVAKKWKFLTMTSSKDRDPNFFLNRPTEIASLSSQQGISMLVLEKFGSTAENAMKFTDDSEFGSTTEDTTTTDSDMVAKHVQDFLPRKISERWEVKIVRKTGSDSEFRKETNSDCVCRGTTTVNLVKKGQDLTIGNIGDSRALLGMRNENNAFVPVMTVDQDELVVLAPAGVWDKLWNGDVQAVVARSPTRLSAARPVVNAAVSGLRHKYKVDEDECAVVCLFLDSPQESDITEMRTKTGLHV